VSQPRLYKRVRLTASNKAKIIAALKSPPVDCRIVDYSAGGACLEVFPMVMLPDRLEFVHGAVKKKCRVVWRRGIRIGVAF
jgi:hypothetical protein